MRLGLAAAGYTYLNVDDCWMAARDREQNGTILEDPTRFPAGLRALVDYVHSRGLRFGLYTSQSSVTCQARPGSYGYEEADAAAYCASKFAVEGLTKATAQALPRGMAAVPLAPGIVQTEMQFGAELPTAEEWARRAVPLIFAIRASDNGKSLSVPGYYSEEYKKSWIIPDCQSLPPLGQEF